MLLDADLAVQQGGGRCVRSMGNFFVEQDLLEGTGGEDVPAREEALVTEVAALRNDMSTALKGLREADGVANPEFAPLLSSINDSLEALRSQVSMFPLAALPVYIGCFPMSVFISLRCDALFFTLLLTF